jgi:hypothetical protein
MLLTGLNFCSWNIDHRQGILFGQKNVRIKQCNTINPNHWKPNN